MRVSRQWGDIISNGGSHNWHTLISLSPCTRISDKVPINTKYCLELFFKYWSLKQSFPQSHIKGTVRKIVTRGKLNSVLTRSHKVHELLLHLKPTTQSFGIAFGDKGEDFWMGWGRGPLVSLYTASDDGHWTNLLINIRVMITNAFIYHQTTIERNWE